MSARPGSKNTSWSAGSSVNSSTLCGGAGAESVAGVEGGLAATARGVAAPGDSAGGRCSWAAGCSAGGGGAVFCPHDEDGEYADERVTSRH